MTIPARYSGVCPECGERWQPGDFIRAADRAVEGLPIWTHAACPVVMDLLTVRPGEVSCRDCFLIHPEGACDR